MRLLITTCAPADAESLVRQLLVERMIGCGNCLPGVRSLYWWQGQIQEDQEALLMMETPASLCREAVDRLRELHPYEVPKILVLDPEGSDSDYRDWLLEVTRPA